MAFAGAQNEDHESDDEGPDELARTDTMEREANMAEAKAKALAASGGASAMGRHDASSPTKAASKLVCVATGTAAPLPAPVAHALLCGQQLRRLAFSRFEQTRARVT